MVAAVMWGFGSIFAVLTYAPGLVLTFYRLWMGAAVLVVVLYGTRRRMSWSLLGDSWVGGVLLAGDMAMFYSAVKSTSVVDATLIGAFQPALVVLASRRLFAERIAKWDVVWIALAMVGATFAVVGHGTADHRELRGDLLATGALLCFSAYWMVSKQARQHYGALEYTTGVTFVAAVVMTLVVVVSRQPLCDVRSADWLWIVLLVAIPGSGNVVMNWAHRFVNASISSAISCLSPLIAAIFAVPILGQSLTLIQVVGVFVGLGAVVVIAARQRQIESTLTQIGDATRT